MVRIYTLTLAPSLDSATITPQIYPEGKLRCTAPVFEPGGGGINVARAIAHLGGTATAIFPAGGATGEHLSTVGAGDSMVGAMTLKLAENASLEEMVRFGVAAGSAATLNQGTRLCSHDDTQKIYAYLSR